MVRDGAIFCAAIHTMQRGFELSVAAASQAVYMTGGEVLISILLGDTLRITCQAVVARNNLDCRKIYAVAAVVEYQQAAESM